MQASKWVRLALFLGLSLAFLASGVSGEDQTTAPLEKEETVAVTTEEPEKLPTIEVVAPIEPGPARTVIKQEDMTLAPYQNLPGYLENQAGIDLTRVSLLGEKNRQVVIRGFDESR